MSAFASAWDEPFARTTPASLPFNKSKSRLKPSELKLLHLMRKNYIIRTDDRNRLVVRPAIAAEM